MLGLIRDFSGYAPKSSRTEGDHLRVTYLRTRAQLDGKQWLSYMGKASSYPKLPFVYRICTP